MLSQKLNITLNSYIFTTASSIIFAKINNTCINKKKKKQINICEKQNFTKQIYQEKMNFDNKKKDKFYDCNNYYFLYNFNKYLKLFILINII